MVNNISSSVVTSSDAASVPISGLRSHIVQITQVDFNCLVYLWPPLNPQAIHISSSDRNAYTVFCFK